MDQHHFPLLAAAHPPIPMVRACNLSVEGCRALGLEIKEGLLVAAQS